MVHGVDGFCADLVEPPRRASEGTRGREEGNDVRGMRSHFLISAFGPMSGCAFNS